MDHVGGSWTRHDGNMGNNPQKSNEKVGGTGSPHPKKQNYPNNNPENSKNTEENVGTLMKLAATWSQHKPSLTKSVKSQKKKKKTKVLFSGTLVSKLREK